MKKILLLTVVLFASISIYAQWVIKPSGITTSLNTIYFINKDTGYVAGAGGKILITNNGGNTWSSQNSGVTQLVNSIYFTDKNNGHACTSQDGYGKSFILKTIDGGINWTKIESPVAYINLYSIYFTNQNTGYIVGGGSTTHEVIYKTTDAGLTWTYQTPSFDGWLSSVLFLSADTGYAISSYTSIMNGTYPLIKTTDAGASWTLIASLTSRKNSFCFPSSNIGYAVGPDYVTGIDGIQKTTDKGITWTSIGFPGTECNFSSVDFVDNLTGFIVGHFGYSTQLPALLRTDNGGISWSQQVSPTSVSMNAVFAINADTVFTVGGNGIILKTTNGGLTPATIISQPEKFQLTNYGDSSRFTVSAVGTPPLSYQWRKNGADINGATGSSYYISHSLFSDDGIYTCRVSNNLGTVVSDSSELMVGDGFEIVGDTVELHAFGQYGSIQWQYSNDSLVWNDLPGATTNPYVFLSTAATTKKRSYRVKVINNECPAYSPVYSKVYRNRVFDNTSQIPTIILYNGCFVFDTDVNGDQMMVTNSEQIQNNQWGCEGTYLGTPVSNADGASNTNAILAGCITRPVAASVCDTLSSNGYTDWFLPAKDQAQIMFNNKNTIPNFTPYYWSSTEANATKAWAIYSGAVSLQNKSSSFTKVRCIRKHYAAFGFKKVCNLYIQDQPLAATFTEQPSMQIKQNGDNAYFRVSTTGTKPISFQWKKDGTVLSASNDSVLTINNINSGNEGYYTCEITNLCRTIVSNPAQLIIADNFEISGDSVELVLNDYNGTVQWQRSYNNSTWTDIPGAVSSPYYLISSLSNGDIVYYRAKVTDPLCPGSSLSYSSVIKHKIISSVLQVQKGMKFNGGIVFKTDGAGNGLISAEYDQGYAPWGCYGTSIPGALSNNDGSSNTTAITSACAERPVVAYFCDTLTEKGFNDWFLPSKNQLNELNRNTDYIGSFSVANYWSSTEFNNSNAWCQSFPDGQQFDYYNKWHLQFSRCIRSYAPSNYKRITTSHTIITQPQPLTITNQPSDTVVCSGSNTSLSITPAGTSPFTYQWKKDGNDIMNATDSIYTISGVTGLDNGMYTCEISNICNSLVSSGINLQTIIINVNTGSDTTFCNTNPLNLSSNVSSNYPSLSFPYSSVIWSPADGLNNPNIPNPSAQPLNDITYTVTYTDARGCSSSDAINLSSITPISFNTPLENLYKACENTPFGITPSISGTQTMSSMLWKKDGIVINNYFNLYIPNTGISDEGIYTCELTNLCGTTISNNAELKVISISSVATAGDTSLCPGQGTYLNSSASSNYPLYSGSFSFLWSPVTGVSNSYSQNTNLNTTSSNTYTIIITDQLGCTSTADVTVIVQNPFSNEQICLVTVDTLSWKNKILWEKTTGVGTLGYNVYKEVATNIYSSIGFVNAGDPATYTDIYSQPEAFANRYKISVVDTCGNESPRSKYHMTMNLTIAANGSTMGLNWSHYIDESGDFVPSLYNIYRGTSPSNMQLLNSVPGTVNSYNDVNVFDVYYYIVGVEKTDGCNTSKTPVLSFSNKKDNATLVGINNNEILSGTILISPNPMSTSATLTVPNFEARNPKHESGISSDFEFRISDLTGKVVRVMSPSSILRVPQDDSGVFVIDRGDLKPGIYFVELNAGRIYRGKLVVE